MVLARTRSHPAPPRTSLAPPVATGHNVGMDPKEPQRTFRFGRSQATNDATETRRMVQQDRRSLEDDRALPYLVAILVIAAIVGLLIWIF